MRVRDTQLLSSDPRASGGPPVALRWLLTVVLLGSLGFAGGGAVLLLVAVPLERWMKVSGWTQLSIDRALINLILVWGICCLVLAMRYYRSFASPSRRPAVLYGLPLASCAGVALVFYQFMSTDSVLIQAIQTDVVEVDGRIAVGPYPTMEAMVALRQQGYSGIISLLDPVVPFEKPLLEEEMANGKAIGLPVRSFPMLPWIAGNEEQLQQIRELVNSTEDRYYVHCYLGAHRARLVAQFLTGRAVGDPVRPLPHALERGELIVYDRERVIVGPFPTDEEWLEILPRVSEVVSVLDPSDPGKADAIAQLEELGRKYRFRITPLPLVGSRPDPEKVHELAAYVRALDHPVFVVGFRLGNWTWALDAALGGSGPPQSRGLPADQRFERGDLLYIGGRWILGPLPTEDEMLLLRAAGIRELVLIVPPGTSADAPEIAEERARAALYGLSFRSLSLRTGTDAAEQLRQLAVYLFAQPGPVYAHAFRTDDHVRIVYDLLQRMQEQGFSRDEPQ